MFTNILPLRHSQQVGVKTREDEDSKDEELTEEEILWRSMVEEALVMHKGLENNEVLDHETVKRFVSPLSVELEDDQYEEAEEYYERSVLEESPEAEAFSRYADFLWMVKKDLWAAELKYLQTFRSRTLFVKVYMQVFFGKLVDKITQASF
ncbi:hypothetical protein PIB30_028955 [Stylosanthes scabra]|uniref:Uncharacterized protein n=1 Tax=Stylosanthes scabra TaxID=79078 RepID=A0ABU6TBW5_9FABA|nr:hypothetical protein [Stylosanthes scabra]